MAFRKASVFCGRHRSSPYLMPVVPGRHYGGPLCYAEIDFECVNPQSLRRTRVQFIDACVLFRPRDSVAKRTALMKCVSTLYRNLFILQRVICRILRSRDARCSLFIADSPKISLDRPTIDCM